MTRIVITFLALMAATTAQAACFADYKAKQDDPLRLHYGVIELRGPCEPEAAQAEVTERIAVDGWQLLTVETIFDEDGLDERQDSAGEYYLRY